MTEWPPAWASEISLPGVAWPCASCSVTVMVVVATPSLATLVGFAVMPAGRCGRRVEGH